MEEEGKGMEDGVDGVGGERDGKLLGGGGRGRVQTGGKLDETRWKGQGTIGKEKGKKGWEDSGQR